MHLWGMQVAVDEGLMADVVQGARAGDEADFTRLVATYHEDLLRVAFVVTGDADAAAEAAQLAWQKAWRRLGKLRDPERVRPWLVAIAANEARQLIRRERRRFVVEIGVRSEPARGSDPTSGIGRIDLVNALGRLKPEDRELLAMRYAVGLDSFEIAAARGGSASGTRARLARVLTQLRRELDRD